MSIHKELYAIVQSSSYTDNISIPLSTSTGCTSYSLYNGSDTISVDVTVKGKTLTVPPSCSSGEIRFERDYFSEITIDTSLGHNFTLELYRP